MFQFRLLVLFLCTLFAQYSTIIGGRSHENAGSREIENRGGGRPPSRLISDSFPPAPIVRPPTLPPLPPPPPPAPVAKPPPPEKMPQPSFIEGSPPTIETTSTTSPSSYPTCPCVKKPGTDTCLVYDTRFQATSVEEAIIHFPDLTLRKVGRDEDVLVTTIKVSSISSFKSNNTSDKAQPGSGPGDSQPISSSNSEGLCTDDECKACSNALIHRLQVNGMLNSDDAEQVRKKFGVSSTSRVVDCSKYNVKFSSGQNYVRRKPQINVLAQPTDGLLFNTADALKVTSLVDDLSKSGLANWNASHVTVEANVNVNEVPSRPQLDTRQKRDTDNSTTVSRIVGERFKIGCIKRGDSMDKTSDWVSLCDCCWVWRKLPSDYFPQYINELVCDSDQKCLSGWGTCQQQFRNVDILRNLGTTGKENWQAVTLESSNFCECAVKTGSALHNFVTA